MSKELEMLRPVLIATLMLCVATSAFADEPLSIPARQNRCSPSNVFCAETTPATVHVGERIPGRDANGRRSGATVVTNTRTGTVVQTVPHWFRVLYVSDDGTLATGWDGVNLIDSVDPNLILVTIWRGGRPVFEIRVRDLFEDLSVIRRTVSHYSWGWFVGIIDGELAVELEPRHAISINLTTGTVRDMPRPWTRGEDDNVVNESTPARSNAARRINRRSGTASNTTRAAAANRSPR